MDKIEEKIKRFMEVLHCSQTSFDELCKLYVLLEIENEQNKKAIKIVQDVKANFPNWWFQPSMYPDGSDNPTSLNDCFEQALKGN